uniref:4-coumarate--CoA ligase n=1 Tax=Albuca bracteata TaxID=82047 RepID=A0A0A1ETJ8_ALBBR|nr:4-coumarate:CoA ligase-like protein [Albuca bracteata]
MAAKSCYDPITGIYTSPRPPLSFPSDPDLSMISFLFRNVDLYPNRLALVDAESGRSFTFAELRSTVSSFAVGLSRLGIEKGDVVLIFSPNSVLFPISFLSIVSLGAVATTVNPLYTVPELSKQALDSRAKLVLTSPELVAKARALNLPIVLLSDKENASASMPTFYDVIERFGSAPAARIDPPRITQEDTAALLYSSGTTGTSKGVVLTHRNFISAAMMLTADQDEEGDPPNTFLCFLPIFHVFGLSVVNFAQLRRGNTVVVMERFDMERMLAAIDRFAVSHLFVVPPVMVGLAKMGKVTKYNLDSLRWICSGAAPVGGDVMEEVARAFDGVDVVQGYGLTETTSIISLERCKEKGRKIGSTGYLMAGIEAKVITVDTLQPVPPRMNGELLFRGPNMMQGYFNNPEATRLTLDDEGWLHTGDLGYFDEKGRLYVEDRIKELIKCKGFQVAPAELEAVLISHPQILDAAVVPMEDAEAGQVPIAFVVCPDSSLTETDVQKFVANEVAPYKRLRRVVFVNGIPKTASGKILRRELTQEAKTLAERRSKL